MNDNALPTTFFFFFFYKILSAASCTTNAITPALKVLDDVYGVERGHVETVHAFTNDQNLIDNFHKGDRRGRSAVLNMVITETGAARAVSKALPQLEGKLTGNAIRVPTPDVSMAILNVKLAKPAGSKDELNEVFRQVALNGELRRQIGYSDSHEAVSTDFVGSRNAGVVDALAPSSATTRQSCTSGTTTSSVTPARWYACWNAWLAKRHRHTPQNKV